MKDDVVTVLRYVVRVYESLYSESSAVEVNVFGWCLKAMNGMVQSTATMQRRQSEAFYFFHNL